MPRGEPRHLQHPECALALPSAAGVRAVPVSAGRVLGSRGYAENQQESAEVTFIGFVLSLAHTAAFHFGDVPDPVTGQAGQVNLAAAHQIIEILALLEQKTRGNLTAEERQLLEQIVYELQMRYVEATKTAPQEASRIIIP